MIEDDEPTRLCTIAELAVEAGATPRAIRFYEAKGLLAPVRVGKQRVYTHRDRGRLLIILRGKRLGFSLAEIKRYLDLYDADPTHRAQIETLLQGARQRIAELETKREDLAVTLGELREIERLCLEAMERLGAESDGIPGGGGARTADASRSSRPQRSSARRR